MIVTIILSLIGLFVGTRVLYALASFNWRGLFRLAFILALLSISPLLAIGMLVLLYTADKLDG